MRITKDYDVRRKEIIDTAERLFYLRGYEKCTVNEILKEVSIAKGTFYHYFKSKEEVLDAIVSRYTDIVVNKVEEIIRRDDLNPVEKLLNAFMAMQVKNQVNSDMVGDIHKAENALFHQKSLSQLITTMAPPLATIIEEGIEKEVWSCRYPLEYMQIFLASSLTLTDEGIFELDAHAQHKIRAVLISMLEKLLDVHEDCFMQLFVHYFHSSANSMEV